MKLAKLTAAIIAAATATTQFSINDFNISTPSTAFAEGAGVVAKLPDWIPNNLESAIEFRNTYGATHIDNGLICVVSILQRDKVPEGEPQGILRYEVQSTSKSVKELRHTNFGSEQSSYYYDIAVFDPQKSEDFDIAVIDTWAKESDKDLKYGHAVARYSFSAKNDMDITETDIYGWLPDCEKEYQDYTDKNDNLSVKDNYIVFCLSHNAGTPYNWILNDTGKECFELETVSDCSPLYSVPLEGGAINTIYAYKAVKDGYDKISYDFTAVYSSSAEGKKTLAADCAVINDAQTILLSGDMRVTLVDYDTGEPLTFDEDTMPYIWTDISKTTPEGEVYCEMQPVGFRNNPAIVRLGDFFGEFNFSFGLKTDNLPVGYSLPDTNKKSAGYYNGTILPEDHMTVTKYDNHTADVVFKLKKNSNINKKTTKITFYDKDTGELIDIPKEDENIYLLKCTSGEQSTSEIFYIKSNPCTVDSDCVYEKSCSYSFHSDTNAGWYDFLEFEIISENADNIELACRMNWKPSGDINGDGSLSVGDVLLMQKWLLGTADAKLANWKAADFCRDNKLDIFDLIKMRKKLIATLPPSYVEPDEKIEFGMPLIVAVDEVKLYLGPNESYQEIASIPANTRIREWGYQQNNDTWLFTEYRGQYGWIKTIKDDGITPTIFYEMVAKKPVIYLYPEQETDVHIELELTEAELSTTYPKYNNGWDVTAYPDGKLLNKADGTHHRYLFWDAVNSHTRYDLSKGFCVAGGDTESFLREKLTYMGLNEDEMNEFIVYWLPLMEHNKYNLISFQGDAYTNSAKLNISPTPDSLLRIFMTYVPLENAVDIEPQQLPTFERKGFTVVEWGGSEIR
ncbi:dockerin type I repeat-containing protein [Ruminococcus sp.]|uniref:dockerin type I repeat-containing protein n=1 Tax=Ruminococcus sp. TaxID=41978 RepID=UPI0025D9742E|nr:dockerin type I repeat-containing protein [Ruminococcus sp.]